MKKFLCLFSHKWEDISAPIVGRRSLGPGQLGEEETFYPDPYGPIKPRRKCVRCDLQQSQIGERWV